MAEATRIDFENPASIPDEQDAGTLAAIDHGILDAGAGRTVPIEEVRKQLPKWITVSASRSRVSRVVAEL
jgi:hypothetical protein